MTYLLQITTTDFELQLKTEVTADTVGQLQMLARDMVKNNPVVVGMKYIVAKYTKKPQGGFESKTLKIGVIEG